LDRQGKVRAVPGQEALLHRRRGIDRGTIDSVLAMAEEIGFEISVIACVLTEGEKRTEYKGIPLISLGHIPLPGFAGR
jgi:hypothetical protein